MTDIDQIPPEIFLQKPWLEERYRTGRLTEADVEYMTGMGAVMRPQNAKNAEYATMKFELPLPFEKCPASNHEGIEKLLSGYIFETVMESMTETFSFDMGHLLTAYNALLIFQMDIMHLLGFGQEDLSAVKGKKFLVLGAGSRKSADNSSGSAEPWFCRYAYSAGGKVVGIDMAEQAGEAFRSYAINLKDDCSLSFLPSGFFDFVVCTKLVDFKDLSSNSVSPVLMRMCDNGELEKMAVRLMMESSRLLANGGKMAATFNREDRVFQKNGKELVLLKK